MNKPTNVVGEIPLTYVKLVHPEYGYDTDKVHAKQLSRGVFYEVERVSMGQSHTTITLKGYKGSFNSVQFEFYNANKQPIDIYNMPEYNHYMDMFNTQPRKETLNNDTP